MSFALRKLCSQIMQKGWSELLTAVNVSVFAYCSSSLTFLQSWAVICTMETEMISLYMICDSWDSTVAHSDVAQFAVHLAFTVRGSTCAVTAKVEPSREVNN